MCGIVGALGFADDTTLDGMLDSIFHRGPDEAGRHVDPGTPMMMGTRRLSIIDVEGGSQPIYSEDGTVAVVFNGEIYNYRSLRADLERAGHTFSTDSDTEVLVHGWEEYGERMPDRLDGMFAFAVWDDEREALFLARDRLGIKPLFYAQEDDRFIWGSELRALLAAGVDRTLDEGAVYDYFNLRYWPWPDTPFEKISKVQPGTSLLVSDGEVSRRQYWDLSPGSVDGSMDALATRLREKLEDAVSERLMADVPLGAFLSGGLDSSTIVALMSQLRDNPVKTFSIGFQSDRFDESEHARYVADHFGTDHHTVEVDISSMDLFADVAEHYGEPLADPAVLPTVALSRYTSTEVKVALSGEGADELLGGYWYYDAIPRHRRLTGSVPAPLHRLAGRVGKHAPVGGKYLTYFASLANDKTAMEGLLTGYATDVSDYVDADPTASRLPAMIDSVEEYVVDGDFYDRKLAFDLKYWLPDDLLYKVDHASMAHSLEVRVPFLDHDLVEFAYAIPAEYKRDGYKPVLKRAVEDIVPDRVLGRDKHGLGVPIASWFRQEHEAIDKWMAEEKIEQTPYVRVDDIYGLWDRHRRERTDNSYTLWKVLNYVAWYHTVVRR